MAITSSWRITIVEVVPGKGKKDDQKHDRKDRKDKKHRHRRDEEAPTMQGVSLSGIQTTKSAQGGLPDEEATASEDDDEDDDEVRWFVYLLS